MRRLKNVWLCVFVISLLAASDLAAAQSVMAIRVRHRNGQALEGIYVGPVEPGGAPDRSDGDGKVLALLPSSKGPGDPITLQVRAAEDDSWVILSPKGGRTFVPSRGNFVDLILIRRSELQPANKESSSQSNQPLNYSDFKRGKVVQHLAEGYFDLLLDDLERTLGYLTALNTFLLQESTPHDRDGTCASLADASMSMQATDTLMRARGQGSLAKPDLGATFTDFFQNLLAVRDNPGILYEAEAQTAIAKTEGRQDGTVLASKYGCSNPHVIAFHNNTSRFARGEQPAHQTELAQKTKSRFYQACDRAIRLNLNGPATEGDLEQVCSCAEGSFNRSRSKIPEDFRDNFLWLRPEGEVINPTAIGYAAHGDLVPKSVQNAADILNWEIRACLGRLPLRGDLTGEFARDWSLEPDPNWDYLGPIVAPTEGTSSPVDSSLGGLLFLTIRHVRHVVFKAFLRDDIDIKGRNDAMRFFEDFHPDASELVILSCSYRTQAKNGYNRWMSTRDYFYWFQPEWDPLTEELLAAAPATHPVHRIGPARDTCPLREPES